MIDKFRELKSEEKNTAIELRKEVRDLKQLNTSLNKNLDEVSHKNIEITAKLSKAEAERERFESALKESLKAKSGTRLEEQPEIFRLLLLLEDRLSQSYPDLNQHLKAQVN